MTPASPEQQVPDIPTARAAAAPDAPALRDEHTELDNRAFADAVALAAGRLRQSGVEAGDVVGLLLPNRVELILALFATWRLGATVTPINPALAEPEIAFQVDDAGCRVVIVESDTSTIPTGVGIVECIDLSDAVPVHESSPIGPSDVALLIYTAGTTGRPKGVMITHRNIDSMTGTFVDHFGLTADDHSLLVLPLFHANGVVLGALSPLRAGGQATITGRFRSDTFFTSVEHYRPTYFSAVPAIYAMLAALPDDVCPDTSSLRFGICGAAPMPSELIERFERRYGVPIVEGYGLSETTTAVAINPVDGHRKPGMVGPPLPGQRIRIVDTELHDVSPGTTGEVLVSGDVVMAGYLNRPDATADTIVAGWLRTGDVGRIDDDGYLQLVDRVKDMIIRGGENLYPKEIENQLYRHPDVYEAAVIGRPHEVLGEVPVAYVSFRPDTSTTPGALESSLYGTLARVKQPVEIIELPDIPKNAVGKIDKPAVRALDARRLSEARRAD